MSAAGAYADLPPAPVSSSPYRPSQWNSPARPVPPAPEMSQNIRPSFVKHGTLAYDPNVQETLKARHQAAWEQVSR